MYKYNVLKLLTYVKDILYILTFILSGDILRYGAIVLCRGQVKHFNNGLDIVPSVRLQSLHTERTRPLDNPNV